jgi:hypothetical protein
MISKYLEGKIELRQAEEYEISSEMIELEYYLIESEVERYENCLGGKVYGIEILKRENKNSIESKLIKNLSHNRENTQTIVGILAKNAVTPTELSFVIDDIIGA